MLSKVLNFSIIRSGWWWVLHVCSFWWCHGCRLWAEKRRGRWLDHRGWVLPLSAITSLMQDVALLIRLLPSRCCLLLDRGLIAGLNKRPPTLVDRKGALVLTYWVNHRGCKRLTFAPLKVPFDRLWLLLLFCSCNSTCTWMVQVNVVPLDDKCAIAAHWGRQLAQQRWFTIVVLLIAVTTAYWAC